METRASYGMQVKIVDEDTKEELTFLLIRAEEENWAENKISMYHPIGKAIFSRTVGNVVYVEGKNGQPKRYRITEIEPT